jgi:hypothetical protein
MDGLGNFTVVWESSWAGAGAHPPQSDPGVGIYGRAFDAYGNALGVDFHVNTTQTGDQTAPAIASGEFVVAWQGPGPAGNTNIFGQRFDP